MEDISIKHILDQIFNEDYIELVKYEPKEVWMDRIHIKPLRSMRDGERSPFSRKHSKNIWKKYT